VHDALRRPLRDVRISVTDRCNFRCDYCMPRAHFGHDHAFLPQPALLTFEEIHRAARLLVTLGVRKIRLTGGEPLLRRGLDDLVAMLSSLRTPDGRPVELALTTNGVLLSRMAQRLKDAGLHRITVSLDALNPELFRRMADADVEVSTVLAGIEAAQAAGLGPVKVNMVVRRGLNDHEVLPMARFFRGQGVELRFIEFMDVGHTNRWRLDEVLPSAEVRQIIHAAYPLSPVDPDAPSDTAQRWRYDDGQGSVGFISSVTQAFCGHCTRLRLSTEGRLYTCLFAREGRDLRQLLRDPHCSDADIERALAALWAQRQDRYSETRRADQPPETIVEGARPEMSYIGG
jgi:GTP 3',8-cyclase